MYKFEKHKILFFSDQNAIKKYKNITLTDMYVSVHGIKKKLKTLWEHFPWLDQSMWFEDWKWHIQDFDTIFILDTMRNWGAMKFIREHNPEARIIVYLENTFIERGFNDPDKYKKYNCEYYTFDPIDAEKRNIIFKTYWCMGLDEWISYKDKITNIEQDVYFIGVDKGRLPLLVNLKHEFDSQGISSNFYIVGDRHKKYADKYKKYLVKNEISYDDVIIQNQRSRAILDIVKEGQVGITKRPMEAILFNKKLITNNKAIEKYDFYCPENIFILGKDSLNNLKTFIHTPYKTLPKQIVEQYIFENWFDTFFTK